MTDFMASTASIVKNTEGEILMVKEGKEHVRGKWDFPGGVIDGFERIEEASKREILEETGFKTDFQKIIGIYFGKSRRRGQPSVDFLTESKINGKGEKNLDFDEEILEVKFFPVEEIEELELRKQNRYRMIKDYEADKRINHESISYDSMYET